MLLIGRLRYPEVNIALADAFGYLRTKSWAAGGEVSGDLGVGAPGTLVRVDVDPQGNGRKVMNFDFTEDPLALRGLVRKFVAREMPQDAVADRDAKGVFAEGLRDKMARIGLMGASVPAGFGGNGGRAGGETGFSRSGLPAA